ncbi:uncharacterized protein LOC116914928 [Rattus rattus]|uniref:uncharacterized protein LOC116914928 n=1 Tax=Rattus rattus TaxID=10117 RepID=UPI0013F31781|nr:uncharacterized protein LOC116914928 [Rattus rattus]
MPPQAKRLGGRSHRLRRRLRLSVTALLLPGPCEVERPRGLRVRAPPGASPGGRVRGGSAGGRSMGAGDWSLWADARRSPVLSPGAAGLRRGREVPGRVPAAPPADALSPGSRQAARRRSFSRARLLALPASSHARSLVFFLSFFALARAGRLFRSYCSRPPSCWARQSGAAGSSPRPPAPALRRRRRRRRSALRLIPIWHGRKAHAPAPPPQPPSSAVLPATGAPRLSRVALPTWPPRAHRLAELVLHGRRRVRGPGSITRRFSRVPCPHLAEDTREAVALGGVAWASDPRRRHGPSTACRRVLGFRGRVLALLGFWRERPHLGFWTERLGTGEVPDPSVPGEARHCSPHVTTSSKMVLAERQQPCRSLKGACCCRGSCARRPGHVGNPSRLLTSSRAL